MLTRDTNAYSPKEAATLTVQEISVQIGAVAGATPEEESFVYDPTAYASGIILSYQVASGTMPAVFLNGLRMVTRALSASSGGDVAYADDVGGTTVLSFVGDTYAVASGDIVYVKYWT